MYNFIICHWLLHVVVLSHLYAAKVTVAVYDLSLEYHDNCDGLSQSRCPSTKE